MNLLNVWRMDCICSSRSCIEGACIVKVYLGTYYTVKLFMIKDCMCIIFTQTSFPFSSLYVAAVLLYHNVFIIIITQLMQINPPPQGGRQDLE